MAIYEDFKKLLGRIGHHRQPVVAFGLAPLRQVRQSVDDWQDLHFGRVTLQAWHFPFTNANLLLSHKVQLVEEVHAMQFNRYLVQSWQEQTEGS